MDALNVFGIRTKIGCMVDLVFEEDSGDFVGDEVWWLDYVGVGVEKVVL